MLLLLTFNSQLMQGFDENDNPLAIQEPLKSCHSSTSAIDGSRCSVLKLRRHFHDSINACKAA
jgi:hypothetical protein